MITHYTDPLGAFLRRIDLMHRSERYDALFNECFETNGTWMRPDTETRRPATHQVEIHMHNIIGVGPTDDEAVRSWIRAARNSRPDLVLPTLEQAVA